MRQDIHRWDVVHAVRRYMALLVTVKLVEGEATSRRVVHPPTSLISDPRRNGGFILQLVARRCGGKLALVPVSYRGRKEKGRRRSHVRSTSGGSCVAASTRTLRSVILCDGVVTTFMAGDRRRPPRTVAYRWCIPSPQWPPSR